MFKIETHLHVSEVSGCARLNAEEMMKIYSDAGYSTVIVTDHFVPRYFERLGDIAWEDKVTIFMSGYFKAREAGRKLGLNVLFGIEISFPEMPNDYLMYGVTREFLNAHPNFCLKTVKEATDIARENGILVMQAHPLRDGHCIPTPEYVDGLEVFNSNPRHDDMNDKVVELANQHGLYKSAGSDAHRNEDAAHSGMMSENEINTMDDFIKLIKSGKAEVIYGELH